MKTGGSIGTAGGRSTGVATATRSTGTVSIGRGLESGRSGGMSSFGNTERFSGFSSKSFKTIARGTSREGSNFKSLTINHNGSIDRFPNSISTNWKTAQIEIGDRTKHFGRKLEATGSISLDTRRPSESLSKTQTLFSREKAQTKGKIMTQPMITISEQGHITRTKTSEQQIVANTTEHRVGQLTDADRSPKKDNPTTFERRRGPFRNPEAKMIITPDGKIKPSESGVRLPTQTQQALRSRTHFIEVNHDGSLAQTPETKTKNTAERKNKKPIRTSADAQHALLAKEAKRHVLKSNIQFVRVAGSTIPQPEVTKPNVEQTKTQKQAIDTIIRSQQVDLANPQQLERQVQRELTRTHAELQPSVQTTTQQSSEKAATKTVTHAETEKLLATYEKTYQNNATVPEAAIHAQRVDVRMQYSPEVKADVEQAVRVMHAYEAVIEQGLYPDTHLKIEQAVLRALNQKLEKTQIQVQTSEEPAVETEKSIKTGIVVQEAEVIQPQTKTLSEELTDEQTVTEYNDEVMRQTNQGLDIVSTQSTLTAKQQAQLAQEQTEEQEDEEDEEMVTEEDEVVEEEEEKAEIELETIGGFEYDRQRDAFRYFIAIQIAEAVFGQDENATVIPGEVFARIMSQPKLYETLASDIAPGPDQFLTEIIEELAEYDYTSVAAVRLRAALLIAFKPAILFGKEDKADGRTVRYVLDSYRFPHAA